MEFYTKDNLSDVPTANVEDLRLLQARNRLEYIWCGMKNGMRCSNAFVRTAVPLFLSGAIVMALDGHLLGALSLLSMLLCKYGPAVWRLNRAYSLYKDWNIFPLVTSEGPQHIIDLDNGERYIRACSSRWRDVLYVNFFQRFLVICVKEGRGGDSVLAWVDDMEEEAKRTILSLWKNALEAEKSGIVLPELYSESESVGISDYIEEVFGDYEYVIHEVISPDIHIDIAVIPPDGLKDYYVLCTMGLGAHRMDVPEKYRIGRLVSERAELMMYLPEDWDLSQENMDDERNYWPIRLIKDFARLSIETGSWIGWGHAMSEPGNEPFAEGVPFSAAVLLYPDPFVDECMSLPLAMNKSIDFYQVFPITQEELEYKQSCDDEESCGVSPTDAMIDHFLMDRSDWTRYLMDERYVDVEK